MGQKVNPHGLRVGVIKKWDSRWLVSDMDFGDTTELKKWLIDNYGILIRDASNFRGLDNHCFRVTARRPEENDLLIEAIRQYKAWKSTNT